MITDPQHADEIITSGQADLFFIGRELLRELLREPYWAIKAQHSMGEEPAWPIQYGYAVKRRAIGSWPGIRMWRHRRAPSRSVSLLELLPRSHDCLDIRYVSVIKGMRNALELFHEWNMMKVQRMKHPGGSASEHDRMQLPVMDNTGN